MLPRVRGDGAAFTAEPCGACAKCARTHTHTHARTGRHADRHTTHIIDTHTQIYAERHTYRLTHSQHAHTHTHTQHAHNHKQTARTHTDMHTDTRTHTDTDTHTHTHTHTHTQCNNSVPHTASHPTSRTPCEPGRSPLSSFCEPWALFNSHPTTQAQEGQAWDFMRAALGSLGSNSDDEKLQFGHVRPSSGTFVSFRVRHLINY